MDTIFGMSPEQGYSRLHDVIEGNNHTQLNFSLGQEKFAPPIFCFPSPPSNSCFGIKLKNKGSLNSLATTRKKENCVFLISHTRLRGHLVLTKNMCPILQRVVYDSNMETNIGRELIVQGIILLPYMKIGCVSNNLQLPVEIVYRKQCNQWMYNKLENTKETVKVVFFGGGEYFVYSVNVPCILNGTSSARQSSAITRYIEDSLYIMTSEYDVGEAEIWNLQNMQKNQKRNIQMLISLILLDQITSNLANLGSIPVLHKPNNGCINDLKVKQEIITERDEFQEELMNAEYNLQECNSKMRSEQDTLQEELKKAQCDLQEYETILPDASVQAKKRPVAVVKPLPPSCPKRSKLDQETGSSRDASVRARVVPNVSNVEPESETRSQGLLEPMVTARAPSSWPSNTNGLNKNVAVSDLISASVSYLEPVCGPCGTEAVTNIAWCSAQCDRPKDTEPSLDPSVGSKVVSFMSRMVSWSKECPQSQPAPLHTTSASMSRTKHCLNYHFCHKWAGLPPSRGRRFLGNITLFGSIKKLKLIFGKKKNYPNKWTGPLLYDLEAKNSKTKMPISQLLLDQIASNFAKLSRLVVLHVGKINKDESLSQTEFRNTSYQVYVMIGTKNRKKSNFSPVPVLGFEVASGHLYQILRNDLKVVISWIRGNPYDWKMFVSNRVVEIQNLTSPRMRKLAKRVWILLDPYIVLIFLIQCEESDVLLDETGIAITGQDLRERERWYHQKCREIASDLPTIYKM
ncbi:unnamed protein product, partial [Meganyctiphanes norvegica]